MKLTLGFSPCPNDTFVFDALVHKKIDTEGLEFDVVFADVEQLNKWAFEERLDVTKLSFNAFAKCISKYVLLDSGSALGTNCGPLLIKKPSTFLTSESKISIPGELTTANLLLSFSNPEYTNKVEVVFSETENQILLGNVDAGLIIHENRFTYQQKGLEKVKDLGEFWERKTKLPLPLGGIGMKRVLPLKTQQTMQRVLRKSVQYAFRNRESSLEFILSHAQEIERDIIYSHIDLYVNSYSVSLGKKGREAVQLLFEKAGYNSSYPPFLCL
jgi:1,4-dihydroxy-6-naphthoate synthase